MTSLSEPTTLTHSEITPIIQALDFAAKQHRYQRRKDDITPYINHPITLVNILWNEANVHDLTVIIAALLHDTVEDTNTTLADLDERFGTEVMTVVREVTDDKTLPKAARKQRQIEHAPHLSDRAKLVKLADKTANLRDMVISPPVDWPMQRQQAYFEWAKAVVDQLRGIHPVLEALFDEAYTSGLNHLQGESSSPSSQA
jgi:(p)ppGpp synthase/HD superfamily hydrolase